MLPELLTCLIVGISDGDTLTARYGEPDTYEQVKIRLAAIDAPERGQPFGRASRRELADLCHGQRATIRVRDHDRYGRAVADVTCREQDASTAQVRAGMAWVYDKYANDHNHLYPLQDVARKTKSGLWRDLDTNQPPIAPWKWRQKKRAAH
jgi:endonuclease YncB( thermonuclease family)